MGELFYREQEGPKDSEIQQPGEGVDYYAEGPTSYTPGGSSTKTRPPGNSGDSDRYQMDPSSAKVIPESMKETLREQVTYVNTASERVAARFAARPVRVDKTAARINDIFGNTGPEVQERSKGLQVQQKRFDPSRGFWTFTVVGDSGKPYTVRVKGVRKSQGIKNLSAADVRCSCSCPFWRWQGPEHWGKTNGYLYGKPRGTASNPVIKDPKEKHWACKHLLAALDLARKYRFSSGETEWSLDGPLVPFPDPFQVARRYAGLTDRVFWHGTYEDFLQIKNVRGGIFWLAFDRDVAFEYGNVYWRPKDSRVHLWEIRLKPSARIIDLRDLSNPIVRKLREAINEAREFNSNSGEPISEKDWPEWADFGIVEGYRWVRGWLRQRKVDGVVVKDRAGGVTDHDSVALFNTKAIKSAERHSLSAPQPRGLFSCSYSRVARRYAGIKDLRPNEKVTVYHGTSLKNVPDLINGFDANRVVYRHYGGPRHAGLFVAPDERTAERFANYGEVILEIDVQAKNLHGTDYSGNIGTDYEESLWEDKFPKSFRPYLSQTLTQSNEPQALLRGLVKPSQVKRVRYKPYGGQPTWYTRKQFLDLGLEYKQPYETPKPIRDLGWDLSYPNYSLDEFVKAYAAALDVEEDRVRSHLRQWIWERRAEDDVRENLEDAGFGPTAANRFIQHMEKAWGPAGSKNPRLQAASG